MSGKVVRRLAVTIAPLLLVLTLKSTVVADPPVVAPATPLGKMTGSCHPSVPALGEIDVLPPGDDRGPKDSSGKLFGPTIAPPKVGEEMLVHGWAPTNLHHQPLYFDDTPLERYGQAHSALVQPLASAARFYGTFAVMPIKLFSQPPHQRTTTLGLYRPGSPVPAVRQRHLP